MLQSSLALEPKEAGLARDIKEPYHIRVCIPCYKEPLELLQLTVTGALSASVPKNCRRTVYLCDDGKDPEKQKWSVHPQRLTPFCVKSAYGVTSIF